MPRSEPIRLREAEAPRPLHEGKVIDAQFRVVGRKRLSGFVAILVALFWAAVIGFVIPQAWLFFESLGRVFAANG